jgi:hypothetical protein
MENNILSGHDMNGMPEYQLAFLSAFDGRVHHLEEGYWPSVELQRR